MQSPISRADLQTLLHEADAAARRLIRKLRLSKDDLADVRQELLVDVIARLPAFDPKRGSLGAFAGIVMAKRLQTMRGGRIRVISDNKAHDPEDVGHEDIAIVGRVLWGLKRL